MNEGLSQVQSQIQNIQLNNEQDSQQIQRDQFVSNEVRYLNFDNYIKYQSDKFICTAQISNDEKFLAIGRQYRKVEIYILKNKKLIKNIKLDCRKEEIFIIKFSYNSRYLLSGDSYGRLCCFDMNKNYKKIYNRRVHSSFINDMLCIDNDQILTCSYDKSLIITNIKHRQQQLKINDAHLSAINGIDFDYSKDIILSCSQDFINLFNSKDGKLQIAHYRQGYDIQMIQLLSKDNNLLCCNYTQLNLWLIDYQRQKLIKLKQFNNQIYNFTSVWNNNYIVIICKESVQILDKNLKCILYQINHNILDIKYNYGTRQINSLKYIIVKNSQNIDIFKKVNKLQR